MRTKLGFLGDIRQFTYSLLQRASFHKVGKYTIKHEYDIILAPLAHAEGTRVQCYPQELYYIDNRK